MPHRPLLKTLSGLLPSERVRSQLEGFVLVEPRALLNDVRERCAARAAAKQVGLTMHASARSASVRAHAFAMAMCELVDNAIDASKRDQDVVVLVSETGDGDLLWQVQDDGVGMSELELAAIGESSGGEALWFGVSLARAVVEAHFGLIHFESMPTFGTTASVWLPRVGRPSASAGWVASLGMTDNGTGHARRLRPLESRTDHRARERARQHEDEPEGN